MGLSSVKRCLACEADWVAKRSKNCQAPERLSRFHPQPHPRKSASIYGWLVYLRVFAPLREIFIRVHPWSFLRLFQKQIGQQFLLRIDRITAEIGHPCFPQNIFIDTEPSRKAFRVAS
jgi:hypothetical protein